ncbi:MAG: thermonuclease family protein [Pseudomonadota bacterium]
MIKKLRVVLFIFLLVSVSPQVYAWQGKVVRISSGDTLIVRHDGGNERISLYGILTPVKAQAFGEKAKKFTSDLVVGKVVRVEYAGAITYEKPVALIYINTTCLNQELVRSGLAWVSPKYCKRKTCEKWRTLERLARKKRIGLWSQPNPVAPWEFRQPGQKTAPGKSTALQP